MYWFQEGGIKYYLEHDTIRFYCQETGEYKVYPVCAIDTLKDIVEEPVHFWCSSDYIYYAIEYRLYMDECGADQYFLIELSDEESSSVEIYLIYSEDKHDGITISYDEYEKSTFEALGKLYDNTIEIEFPAGDSLNSVIFSLEYGIIQYQFLDITFSLINDEL